MLLGIFKWIIIGFSLEFGQSWTAASQDKVSPTAHWHQLLKLSIIVFHLLSLCSPSSSMLSLLISTLLSPSPLCFPVAGNSHNCGPKFPSIAEGSGVWLGRVWMLSSSGSLSAASKQRMLLPASKALLHTRQTGGQESEYSFFFLTGAASLKLADREECLTNNCCEFRLIWNYPIIGGSQGGDCKTTQKAGRGLLSTARLRGSFWRSCKVGLRWCDKPGQTLWLSSNLQQAKPGAGCCQCLYFTLVASRTNSWCVHNLEEHFSDWLMIRHFMKLFNKVSRFF